MARQFRCRIRFPPVGLLPPAADAAGRTSAYRDLAQRAESWVVVHVNQGNAAQVTLSILQGQDVSRHRLEGGRRHADLAHCAATATSDALAVQTAGGDLPDLGDTSRTRSWSSRSRRRCAWTWSNGFHTIAVQTSASNAANITEAELFIWESYQGASAPSTLV